MPNCAVTDDIPNRDACADDAITVVLLMLFVVGISRRPVTRRIYSVTRRR